MRAIITPSGSSRAGRISGDESKFPSELKLSSDASCYCYLNLRAAHLQSWPICPCEIFMNRITQPQSHYRPGQGGEALALWPIRLVQPQ